MKLHQAAAAGAAFLAGALLSCTAWSAEPSVADKDAYAKLPVCQLSKDGKRLAVEPCRRAPPRVPMPRRAVPLTVERMPGVQQAPQVAMPQVPPSRPGGTLNHPSGAPIPTGACTGAGCYTPSGQVLPNGVGNTVVLPSGRPCNRNGAVLQC